MTQKRTEEHQAKNPRASVDEEEESRRAEDERMTWTGKRVRDRGSTGPGDSSAGGVGKYLKAALADRQGQEDEDEIVELVDEPEPEPARKRFKGTGGFGDFSSWG